MESTLLISAFERLRCMLRLKAASILGSDTYADDAVQEAFCKLWSAAGDKPGTQAHAEALTRTAVRNASIDILRRAAQQTSLDDVRIADAEDATSADAEQRSELIAEVNRIIDSRLAERDRQMLRLREMHGYEWSELAEKFGVTEANARMIVSRARKAIREYYRQQHSN